MLSQSSHTAYFNPATLLEAFLNLAGNALGTVTSMDVFFVDDGVSAVNSARLSNAMVLLAGACPALQRFGCKAFQAENCTNFLLQLGQACPLLSAFSVHAEPDNIPFMQQIVQLLPSLLPQLSMLCFPSLHGGTNSKLPDLSQHVSIISLKIRSFTFSDQSQWERLPPKLLHLECESICEAPAVLAGKIDVLHSLLTLLTYEPVEMNLSVLAQVLLVAPALQKFGNTGDCLGLSDGGDYFVIKCPLSSSSVASDLLRLNDRMLSGLTMSGILRMIGNSDGQSLGPISLLPCMTLVKKCILGMFDRKEMCLMLDKFPHVEELMLWSPNKIVDDGIKDLAVCKRLTCLVLNQCNTISTMDLVVLCKHLHTLRNITCDNCAHLQGHAFEVCATLLEQQFGVLLQIEVYMGVYM